MRRLDEVGAPLPLAASAEQAVEKLFREGPQPHHMYAMRGLTSNVEEHEQQLSLHGMKR